MTREEIDERYLNRHGELETEFFDATGEGLSGQRRVLKTGKSIDEFNTRHGELWQEHEAELIDGGYIEAPPVEPVMNLAKEVKELKEKVEKLEKGL